MSARLLDEARAFEIIAPFLEDARRTEVAGKLADRLAGESKPGIRPGIGILRTPDGLEREVLIERPEYELAASDPVTGFLKSLGYAEGELVRASGRLASAVRQHRDAGDTSPISDELLARLWNEIREAARA